MPIEKQVVALPSGLKVHVERHVFDPAFETVILVNGALATTASFGQTIRYLGERVNAVCFDLPYAGQSRQHNPGEYILTKDDEVEILLHLAERFEPSLLLSVSWGGVASLFALARGCASVRRAVIASFSPFLNDAMTDYVTRARDHIAAGENLKAAQLLNDTVGRYLPRIMKLYNYRYLTKLPRNEQDQVAFHVDQILAMHAGAVSAGVPPDRLRGEVHQRRAGRVHDGVGRAAAGGLRAARGVRDDPAGGALPGPRRAPAAGAGARGGPGFLRRRARERGARRRAGRDARAAGATAGAVVAACIGRGVRALGAPSTRRQPGGQPGGQVRGARA
ncbi:alpha/beta hydrolase family protein [Burkholderia pseudomallei MSHR3458]|nr:alpha/beta hydrolase family protein [Burkholderia pseudomallei MSHR3458]